MSANVRSKCLDCGGEYGGNAGHCKACHQTFSSDSGFDRHLISSVHAGCHDPRTLRDKKHNRIVFAWDARRQLWKFADYSDGSRWANYLAPDGLPHEPEFDIDYPEEGR